MERNLHFGYLNLYNTLKKFYDNGVSDIRVTLIISLEKEYYMGDRHLWGAWRGIHGQGAVGRKRPLAANQSHPSAHTEVAGGAGRADAEKSRGVHTRMALQSDEQSLRRGLVRTKRRV